MAITKVINDAVDLNQSSDYRGLRLPVGTTGNVVESFTTDYLVVGGGGGTGTDSPGGGGAGGLRTSYNNSTTTTNSLSFPSGKTAIATYMLDNNATDISNNYNGTETNITYNTGQYGGGAVFNGSSSVIQLGTNIFKYTNVTISAFINPSLSNTSVKTIFGNTSYVNGQSFYGIIISVRNDGSSDKIYVQHYPSATAVYSTGTIPLNTFTHVAVSYTGSQTKIYINGSLDSTHSASLSYSASQTLTASLGAYLLHDYSGSTTYDEFSGTIDQVRIYDSILSSNDVSNIHTNEVQANSGGGTAAESSLTLEAGTAYNVTVGAGGFKTSGSNSVFSNITSTGGGSGGGSGSSSGYNGGNGGSGGGASGGNYSLPGGNGTTAQGYAGGGSGSQAGSGYPGGGGGGASAKGQTLATSSDNGGTGGDGVSTNILNSTNAASASVGEVSGSNVYYSGGGGGSTYTTTLGAGGLGGGADGQRYLTAQVTNDGITNTGGGGGAENSTGGSGVVILRYPTAGVSSFTTTGTLNIPSTTDTVANVAYPVTNTAYYKLDGNVNEATGTYTANAYGITYSNGGVYNQAAKFDGSAYIDSGYTAVSSTSASISLWVNITAYTTYGGFAIDSTGTGAQARFTLGQGGGTSGNLWVSVGNGSSAWADESTVSLAGYGLNTWFHLVGTVNGTTVKIYINGSLIHTFTSSVSYVGGGQHNYYFGGWGNSLKLNGLMDQIRLYSTDLSQAYVTDLYNEHYQTQFTEGSDTAIVFTQGTGTVTFSGVDPSPPQGALRANTSYSEDGSGSVIEHYNGTDWKYFDAIKYCTTNTLNFPLGAGCIASYNLDNNVNDIGNTYNGVNNNVTFNASGKFGAAAVFNGSNSYIDTNLKTQNVGSHSVWFKADANPSGTEAILASGYGSSQTGVNIMLKTNGQIRFNINDGGGAPNALDITTTSSYADGNYHNIVATWDLTSSGTNCYLYIDNDSEVVSGSGLTSGWTSGDSTYNIFIGAYYNDSQNFDGSIDQVRIFDNSLTSNEVAQLYNNEIACS